jgi:hypothetical protein
VDRGAALSGRESAAWHVRARINPEFVASIVALLAVAAVGLLVITSRIRVGPTFGLVAVIWAVGFATLTAAIAERRDRNRSAWLVLGAILGPIGLLLLMVVPPGLCRGCGTPTRGMLWTCWWCGQDVTEAPRAEPQPPDLAKRRMPARRAPRAARAPERNQPPTEPSDPTHWPEWILTADEPTAPASRSKRGAQASSSEVGPAIVNSAAAGPPATSPTTGPAMARSAPSSPPRAPVARTSPPVPVSPIRATGAADPGPGPALTGAGPSPANGGETVPLATAIFVTGSGRLEPGRRYGIAMVGASLRFLGPTDLNPGVVALERPLAGLQAQAMEGRIVISEPMSRLVLAFMSVSGPSTATLAETIQRAAGHVAG